MKKITHLIILFSTLLIASSSFGQSAVVIGTSHSGTDSFSFLVTAPIANGENVYFSEDEYNNTTNVFASGESVVRFTASSALTVGTVVRVQEGANNVLSVTCSGGGSCGTATVLTSFFSLRTDGEAYYSYSDTDGDPSNGVTEIYSVFYTGESGQATGGPIPAALNPTPDYPNAIVIDGFPSVSPSRSEYAFAGTVRDNLCRTDLENIGNYLHAQPFQPLSTTIFTSFTLSCSSPSLSVSRTPASVVENSGSPITFTFTLAVPAPSPITVNFTVGGTATFPSDYGQTGAATFGAASGTVVIGTGATTANVVITPSADSMLEPDETVILTATAGTGYTVGSPSSGTGTITNDDTMAITPLVAVTGLNNAVAPGIEGFSFVALDDIPAGTEIFFTEEEFNNNTLAFSNTSGEGVVRWTAPAGGVLRGEVIVGTENTPDVFTPSCNSGTCGTFTTIVTGFTFASNGEGFFAYSDSDLNPTNGVTQVHSVLFTGTNATPGGNIPALEDPSSVYIGAVVVDGFPAVQPVRTEYNPALRGVTVDQANFQNTGNWLHAQANATLSTVPFTNIVITTGSANPQASITVAPASVVEDSGSGLVYTVTLDAAAVGDITINFDVTGSATLTTDYTQSGAATFSAAAGTVVILNGTTSATVTLTPVIDTDVEPTETIELMIASGTGYDGGTPNAATGSITNDDTSDSDPLVAIMGMAHDSGSPDAFAFVAAQDIPAGTVVYFTENEFDNTDLMFNSGESVLQWTAPGGQIDQGDVIVITETAPDVFAVTCSDTSGNGCGSISVILGGFALASNGETMYAYQDSDTDPTNGVDDIYSVMYTGTSATPGGNLPAVEDPSGIYLNALVVDGFPAVAPNKTEYTPSGRAIAVSSANFEDPLNYDHAAAIGSGLSTVPFASLSIVVSFTAPADLCVDAGVQSGLSGGSPTGGVYSGPGVTDDGNGMTYSFDPAAAGVGVHTITYTVGGTSATDDIEVFALPVVAFTALADLCLDAGVQTGLGGGTPPQGTVAGDMGVYSGPGVTDDGNGMTYSFDPAAAGVGTHTITYVYTDGNGCAASATDDVEVFALPVVAFTAPADLCVDAGVQAGLGGGTPTGGVYSGPGVTDDGNGMTYSFDPAAAGVGVHTLTYTFTDANGCSASATDNIEVFALPVVAFTAPADLCIDAGVQAGLGGGTPTGGVYSGPGVTDDGNGMTYSFDPAAAGVGVHTLTYTLTDGNGCTNSATDDVEVFALPVVAFTAPADLCVDAGVQAGLGGGTPTGGVYSGPGVTDDGNGMTYSFDPAAAGVGVHTLTYAYTDANGCTNSASDDVEVFALPVVTFTAPASPICPGDILTGQGGGTPTGGVYSGPGVTDDGNGMTYTFDAGAAGLGTHTITYTFTDGNGCTNSASDTVTVEDTTPPVITCPGDITQNNDPGVCGAIVTFAATATDNCPTGLIITYSQDPGTLFPVGTTVVTATATDVGGNTDVCTFNVTVNDTENPIITCPADATVECGSSTMSSSGTAVANYTGGTQSWPTTQTGLVATLTADVTGIPATATITDVNVSFEVDHSWVGDLEVTLVSPDGATVLVLEDPTCGGSGNSDNVNATLDDESGVGSVSANCTAGVDTGGAPNPDACPQEYLVSAAIDGTFDPDNPLFALDGGLALGTWTLQVVDDAGGDAGCIHAFSVTVDWDDAGSPFTDTSPAATGMATATDNCDATPAITFADTSVAGCGNTEVITRTWTATDSAGNSSTCTQTITVVDTTPPVITCPADVTVECGDSTAPTSTGEPTGTDTCGSVSFTFTDVSAPGCGLTEVITRTWTGTDECGNMSITCDQIITVVDTTPPVVVCPADVTVECGDDTSSTSTGVATGTDGCGMVTISEADTSVPGCGNTEIITRTWTATDACGNTSTCTQTITVVDTTPPAITCPADITLECGTGSTGASNGTAVANYTGGTQSWPTTQTGLVATLTADVTGIPATATITDVNVSFEVDHSWVGDLEVTLVSPDGGTVLVLEDPTCGGSGNSDNVNATLDDESGVGSVSANCTAGVDTGGAPNPDACPQEYLVSAAIDGTFDPDNPLSALDGGLALGTWTLQVVDDAGGDAGCIHAFSVTVDWDDAGVPFTDTSPAVTGTATGSDGCGGVAITFTDVSVAGCGNTETITRTWTATDDCGNTTTCDQIITVVDTTPPTPICPTDITVNNDPGVCGAIVTYILPSGDDTCGTTTTNQTAGLASGDTFPVGTTTNTFLIEDECGNSSTCSFDVTVVDNEPPVAVCQDITIQLDANGDASITAGQVDGGSTDNCGIASLAVSPSVFGCTDVGPNTVTLTVTDVNGNSSTCTAIVTVEDNVPPVAVCQDITIQLDANGDASIVAGDIDGGSTDACGIASIMASQTDFTCADVGPNNVTLTVTDVNGNSSTCIAIVTVEDNIPPMLTCPADILAFTNGGNCGATVTFAEPVATDNCGIDFIVQQAGIASGEVFPVGVTTNQFIVVDVNGNTATCSFTVTVEDNTDPMAVCQDITVMLDATGTAVIVAGDVDGGSTDNCLIDTLSIDIDTFTCADLGDNTVTLTVTDTSGNTDTCEAIVTVVNGVAPTAVCQDASVALDAVGMVSITDASIFDGGSVDACGGTNLTFSVSPSSFTCDDLGENTVTLTVTDDGGNTSTCTAILTVEDLEAPTVSCMDLTVSLDENGAASINPADLVVMSADNCGVVSTTADITDFDCDDVGAPVTVTVTVEDEAGNTASCTATVTVLDEIAPALVCPADLTVQTVEGTQYEVANFVASGVVTATDNCTDPVIVVSQDPAVGDLLDPGVYPVSITVADDSGNETSCTFDLTVESVLAIGDTSFDISSLSLFPNPASDYIVLSNPQQIPLEDVAIYDVTGRLVKTIDARQMSTELTIDIFELASATYLFIINADGAQVTHQIVKE